MNVFDRFMSKVEVQPGLNGCWLWLSKSSDPSYRGGFTLKPKVTMSATRASYHLFKCAYLPDNRGVLHTCDTPRCVNPGHLWLGTSSDNAIDMVNKGRHGMHKGFGPISSLRVYTDK